MHQCDSLIPRPKVALQPSQARLKPHLGAVRDGGDSTPYDCVMVSFPPLGSAADEAARSSWLHELCLLLAGTRRTGGGVNPPWTSAEPCVLLTEHVARTAGVGNLDLAREITWQLVVRAAADHEPLEAPQRPLLTAYLLLGLGDPDFYPRAVDELWPKIGRTLSDAQRRVQPRTRPSLHDPRRALHRQALAISVTYPDNDAGRNARKHFSGPESVGIRETASALLERVLASLTDLDALEAARSTALQVVEQRRAAPIIHREADDSPPSDSPRPRAMSAEWTRLNGLSRLLAKDLDSGALRDEELLGLSASLYVRRDVEDALFADVLDPHQPARVIIRAEAGHGKSSLLWSLHRRLTAARADTEPLLLSCSWLLTDDGRAASLSPAEILRVVGDIQAAGVRPIVLLDTADLLLHDERLRLETRMLLEAITDLGADWVITSRPRESEYLSLDRCQYVHLGAYSNDELDDAVVALASALCPDADRSSLGDRIRASVARGQPVAEVCRSPLLLRLLFELNQPNEPGLEIDTSGLYARFWERRVRADPRSDAVTAYRPDDDLTAIAGAIAIVMLAEVTPDCPADVLAATVPRVLAELPQPLAHTYATGLELLRRRGVIHLTQRRVRFLHQTMFEYAAAIGLFHRQRDDARKLLLRVAEKPYDLLTGAVLEQLLIVNGNDAAQRSTSAIVVDQLLDTDEITLHAIGLTALAHHPKLLPSHSAAIAALPVPSVRHLARVLPTVYHRDESTVLDLLTSLWKVEDSHLRLNVVEALSRISHRIPEGAARFARDHDVCEYVVAHQADSPTVQRTLPRLLGRIAAFDPTWVRASMLTLLTAALTGREGRAIATALLRTLSEVWRHVGSEAFLAQIVDTVTAGQANRDTDSRAVRESLGTVYAAQWELSGSLEKLGEWTGLVESSLRKLQDDDESISAGAMIVALMYGLAEASADDPRIPVTLDAMLTMDNEGATRQLQRSALPVAMSRLSPLAVAVSERLQTALARIVEPRPDDEQLRLAEVARSTLTDERISDRLFVLTLPDAVRRDVAVWLDRQGLVALTARAAKAGVAAAQEAMVFAVDQPQQFDEVSRNLLLDGCVEWNKRHTDLIEQTVPLAIDLNRIPPVQQICRVPTGPDLLARFADDLRAMVRHNLGQKPADQSAGARLLLDLMTFGVLPAELSYVETAINTVKHPEATATLIRALALFIRGGQSAISSGITICRQYLAVVPEGLPQLTTASGRRRTEQPVVLEACRDTWLELAAFDNAAQAADWPTVRTLTLAPRLMGTEKSDLTGFGNAGRFISGLVIRGDIRVATDALLGLIGALQDGHFSTKQTRTGVHKLRSAIRTVVSQSPQYNLDRILTWLPSQDPVIAAVVARSIVQHAGEPAREALIAAATFLDHDVRRQINDELRQRELSTGAGSFTEIL